MNVLVLLPSLKKTGPINVALEIIRNYPSDVKVHVISVNGGDLLPDFLSYSQDVKVSGGLLCFILDVIKATSVGIYDICHSHCLYPDLVNAFFSRKSKKIATLHNYIFSDYKFEYGFLKGFLFSVFHVMSLRFLDKVVGCSSSVTGNLKTVYGIDAYPICNGVEPVEFFEPVDRKLNSLRLIYIGVLNERKNIELILRTISENSFLLENIHLDIVGDGPDLESFKRNYSSVNISFHGRLDTPYLVSRQCDYYISSSLAEGLPMALLESMSYGLSYIVSNIEPHVEINKIDFSSGFIFNNDPLSLKDVLIKVISLSIDEKEEIKIRANNVYKQNFTAEIMSKKYVSFFMQQLSSIKNYE